MFFSIKILYNKLAPEEPITKIKTINEKMHKFTTLDCLSFEESALFISNNLIFFHLLKLFHFQTIQIFLKN
jgi:hypothetical protein